MKHAVYPPEWFGFHPIFHHRLLEGVEGEGETLKHDFVCASELRDQLVPYSVCMSTGNGKRAFPFPWSVGAVRLMASEQTVKNNRDAHKPQANVQGLGFHQATHMLQQHIRDVSTVHSCERGWVTSTCIFMKMRQAYHTY